MQKHTASLQWLSLSPLSPLRTQVQGGLRPSFVSQRGAILLITLISLALLMLSTMALIRSFDTSLSLAGNMAFKRDLTNQGERGIAKATSLVKSGVLGSSNVTGSNYSASTLTSDSHGLPNALLKDSAFGFTGADITDVSAGVTVRYVIDRQCQNTTPLDISKHCSFVNVGTDSNPTYQAVYRISVRANGPRNTQVYLQTTVTN